MQESEVEEEQESRLDVAAAASAAHTLTVESTGRWSRDAHTFANLASCSVLILLMFFPHVLLSEVHLSISLFVQKCNKHWTGHQGKMQPPLILRQLWRSKFINFTNNYTGELWPDLYPCPDVTWFDVCLARSLSVAAASLTEHVGAVTEILGQ